MSYVYGVRGTGKLTPLVLSLRKELYCASYDAVDWNAARNQCAPSDLYYPHPKVQDVLWWALYQLERPLLGSVLRQKALAEVMRHVHYEVGARPASPPCILCARPGCSRACAQDAPACALCLLMRWVICRTKIPDMCALGQSTR